VPTAALRKNYQGVSPPALPTPVATEPLAAKAPQVPETKTPTCDGSGDAGLTEGKVDKPDMPLVTRNDQLSLKADAKETRRRKALGMEEGSEGYGPHETEILKLKYNGG
ncbi:unnamed protein product, partial [Durusdinium trenchii]